MAGTIILYLVYVSTILIYTQMLIFSFLYHTYTHYYQFIFYLTMIYCIATRTLPLRVFIYVFFFKICITAMQIISKKNNKTKKY